MIRHLPALLLIAALGGCASLPPPDSRLVAVEAALESAARQVRRCYRAPRVGSAARAIVTRLRVRLTPEGQLAGLPLLVDQAGVTEANRRHAQVMAQAAITAVMRCAPLTLPPALHAAWSEFDLTFSPLSAA